MNKRKPGRKSSTRRLDLRTKEGRALAAENAAAGRTLETAPEKRRAVLLDETVADMIDAAVIASGGRSPSKIIREALTRPLSRAVGT